MTAADVSWSPSAYHADKSGDYDLKIKKLESVSFHAVNASTLSTSSNARGFYGTRSEGPISSLL